jgi:hypothetical protein
MYWLGLFTNESGFGARIYSRNTGFDHAAEYDFLFQAQVSYIKPH